MYKNRIIQILVIIVSISFIAPSAMAINLSLDNLFVNDNESLGKPSTWERLWSGQYWLDWLYGESKVSVNIWDNNLKLEGLSSANQQVICKVISNQISTLERDFPYADIEYIYNETAYSYVKVTLPMEDVAQRWWANKFSYHTTLADKSYISKISINQQLSLVTPLDYADEHDVARTTYNLCDDYGILDMSYNGDNITIAVLDTGVRNTHNGLVNLTLFNESFVIDENWNDRNGHGTHCIGIVAGSNVTIDGEAYRGVAPNATVYSLKVLDSSGRGTEDDIVSGIMRAVELNVDIISMSLGGSIDYYSTLHDALHYAIGKGIIVVCASGNSADIVSAQPASWEGIISVEALNEAKHLAPYSCLGGDISAEGTNITSMGFKSDSSTSTKTGTSMATPFVAGCIALLLEAQPSLRGKPEKVIEYLKESGNYAPSGSPTSIKWSIIPLTSDNYAYDTREVNPADLVDLSYVSDTTKQVITDVRTQLLRDSGI